MNKGVQNMQKRIIYDFFVNRSLTKEGEKERAFRS